VAAVYFDSSAFIKLVLEEQGTDLAAALWDNCDAATSSRLAYPEVHAALAAAVRAKRLDPGDLQIAERDWERIWSDVRAVELSVQISHQAGRLCRIHRLKGADGVHLASALAVNDGNLIVAGWDQRLQTGAVEAGLRVAPTSVPKRRSV
jgi:predicted nucleic acid-binding protein